MSIDTKHEQAPFVDYFGNTVEVDLPLVCMLEELLRLGVRTDYSCQDTRGQAYFLATAKTIWPVFKYMYKLHKKGAYTVSSRKMIKCFLRGSKCFNVHAFGRQSMGFDFEFKTDAKQGSRRYSLEYSINTHHGFRVTVRFPTTEISRMTQLVKETADYWASQK